MYKSDMGSSLSKVMIQNSTGWFSFLLAGMVQCIDDSVADIVTAFNNSGMLDNGVVFFLSSRCSLFGKVMNTVLIIILWWQFINCYWTLSALVSSHNTKNWIICNTTSSICLPVAASGGTGVGSSNEPLRGTKGTHFEGGIRVNAFLHSPTLLPDTVRGTSHHGLFHISDLYPTLQGLAGVSTKDMNLDGQDIWTHIMWVSKWYEWVSKWYEKLSTSC